jgi:hypothetical protein
MRTSRFTDEQIVSILHNADAGGPIAEFCRKHQIMSTTCYRWKRRYGGMKVNEAKRLRKSRRRTAASSASSPSRREHPGAQGTPGKRVVTAAQRRAAVAHARSFADLS